VKLGALKLSAPTRWGLAACAGVLNGIAFIFYGPVALIANIPLFIALMSSQSALESAALSGLVGFIGGLHIYGILNYGALIFWGFASYTASQMLLYALLLRLAYGRSGPWADVALPALIWTLTEWIRTIGPLAMPASYVGCIAEVSWLSPWLALAPWTGGLGVSSLIALVQSLLFHLFFGDRRQRRVALILGLLSLSLGLPGIFSPPELGDKRLSVAGVQGGLANAQYSNARADPAAMRDIVRSYEALSQRAYARGSELVVWPETAVRAPVLKEPELQARLFPQRGMHSTLIAGLLKEDQQGKHFNLAAAVYQGEVIDEYAKVRLVPRTEAHLSPGERWRPLQTPLGLIGVMICLESVYPDSARTLSQEGAQLLVVMSNDAGFGRSPITRHMTHRAIIRALENGRWLLRVGQAGISALINPRGQIQTRLGIFEPGLLLGEARLREEQTLYTRWGDWWMACVALLLLLIFIRRKPADVVT